MLLRTLCLLLPLALASSALEVTSVEKNRTFTIDYERDTFLMGGKPFRYMSGSIHYFRVPRKLWRDRLTKIRAAGFNAIQFVIQWNLHEPEPGRYDFSGRFDVEAFVKLAGELGLFVILRPGPYICAERNGGGLPYWLYRDHPGIKLRTKDPNYLKAVERWWRVLLPKMRPLLYVNGGNIIMSQLENEYGSFGLQTGYCDVEYMVRLRDLSQELLGEEVILYTTDGNGIDYLRCGSVAGAYATVDFGPGTNVTEAFRIQRLFEPRGPLINSEYYPGWLDYWGQPHSKVNVAGAVKTLTELLEAGANVNVYMAHGGTSFAFENGANNPPFSVEPTSYDYDALITEDGRLTQKYEEFKKVIGKHFSLPTISPITDTKAASYGMVSLSYVSSFFDSKDMILKFKKNSTQPLTFEQLSQEGGFVLYETTIARLHPDPSVLKVSTLHDRANVYVNREPVGIMSRAGDILQMPLTVKVGDVLQILVENQGRIGYGPFAKDFKGIVGHVSFGGQNLTGWSMYGMPLDKPKLLEKYATETLKGQTDDPDIRLALFKSLYESRGQGSFWHGTFNVPCQGKGSVPRDTFLLTTGWSKGVAIINGVNLGRYWPLMGPQETLYVPSVYLRCGNKNSITLFEQEKPACPGKVKCSIAFVAKPQIDGPTPVQLGESLMIREPSPFTNEVLG